MVSHHRSELALLKIAVKCRADLCESINSSAPGQEVLTVREDRPERVVTTSLVIVPALWTEVCQVIVVLD